MAYGYFIQGCPVCGRRVQIRLEYLGKYVTCHHCGAAFLASGTASQTMEREELPPPRYEVPTVSAWLNQHATAWPFGREEDR